MLHALVMAGGAGTRFWPESRAALPKQLLRLGGNETLLETTLARLSGLVPPERITVATAARLARPIQEQLPQLDADRLILEPCKRDTAPCIALAALRLLAVDPDATMLVCPADHVLGPTEAFEQAIRQAARLVDEEPRRLATFGIRPTYPAESFGYIERGEALAHGAKGDAPAFDVARFHEKPKGELARQYLAAGSYYWNAGIFVWRAATIRDALAEREPEMLRHLARIVEAHGTRDEASIFEREFAAVKPISIDYAVLEHWPSVVVIEAPFDWDDVGSWQALSRLAPADSDGNVTSGAHVGIDTTGSIIRAGDGHLVVTLGVRDLVIVHTPDVTLVANKHDEESIRRLTQLLAERGLDQYL
jgi:mannose-1-phosphate guanylyltransferase